MNGKPLYVANSLCMLVMAGILMGAFYFQYMLHEAPCPLCLLQRMGMIGIILGLSLNTFFGFSIRHFALVIIAAVVGGGYSARQVLLHVAPKPGDSLGYGTPFDGIHLYTWGLMIFAASILGSTIFLLLVKEEDAANARPLMTIEKLSFYLCFLICFANVVSTSFM